MTNSDESPTEQTVLCMCMCVCMFIDDENNIRCHYNHVKTQSMLTITCHWKKKEFFFSTK